MILRRVASIVAQTSEVPENLGGLSHHRPALPFTSLTSSSVNPFLRSRLIHKRIDLSLEHRLDVRRPFGGHPFVQVQHALYEGNHLSVFN